MSVPLELSLSFTHIKTPQLIGIIAGCLVFTATISAVVLLLYKSGTLSRFRDEMMSGTPLSLQSSKKEDIAPQSSMLPELYEHLLSAALTLPIQPCLPELRGKNLLLRPLETDDLPLLIAASNGTALYGESAYDPARIWGWINSKSKPVSSMSTDGSGGLVWPCRTEKEFLECYRKSSNSQHLVLIDRVTQKQIGILSLVDNRPEDLNIRIGKIFNIISLNLFCREVIRIALHSISCRRYGVRCVVIRHIIISIVNVAIILHMLRSNNYLAT